MLYCWNVIFPFIGIKSNYAHNTPNKCIEANNVYNTNVHVVHTVLFDVANSIYLQIETEMEIKI